MRFALVQDGRAEAEPGREGFCPGCEAPLVAKCGKSRIWHWAHRGARSCDPWWEPETEWHRGWKSHFPIEHQEVRQRAEDGEWHIADVKTSRGLVFEFQHSHLDPLERVARDNFYPKLIWIVDGNRLKKTSTKFFRAVGGAQRWRGCPEIYTFSGALTEFPQEWIDCRHPVVFDFIGPNQAVKKNDTDTLWCLLPGRARGHAVLISLTFQRLFEGIARSEDPIGVFSYLSLITNAIDKISARQPTRRARF